MFSRALDNIIRDCIFTFQHIQLVLLCSIRLGNLSHGQLHSLQALPWPFNPMCELCLDAQFISKDLNVTFQNLLQCDWTVTFRSGRLIWQIFTRGTRGGNEQFFKSMKTKSPRRQRYIESLFYMKQRNPSQSAWSNTLGICHDTLTTWQIFIQIVGMIYIYFHLWRWLKESIPRFPVIHSLWYISGEGKSMVWFRIPRCDSDLNIKSDHSIFFVM